MPAGDTFYIARYLVSGDDQASLYVEVQDVQGTDVICVAKNNATLDGLLTVRVEVHARMCSSLPRNAPH
eukprot:1157376-Pelagomonas_calceolata.AAC.1